MGFVEKNKCVAVIEAVAYAEMFVLNKS